MKISRGSYSSLICYKERRANKLL